MTQKKKNQAIRASGRIDLVTICHRVSERTGIAFPTLNAASKHLFREIRAVLEQQQEVEIPDFGRFELRQRKERYNSDVTRPGIRTYTPACSTIKFRPDKRWESWQRFHSAHIPDEIPEGMQLSADYRRSSFIRQQTGDQTPMEELLSDDKSREFYREVIIRRAVNKANKANRHEEE